MEVFENTSARTFGCVLAACLMIGLSDCNIIVTKEPLFASGAPNTPSLKDGVWIPDQSGACRFDETRSAETWPNCAKGWGAIRGHEILGYDRKKEAWEGSQQFILSAGDPIVMQVHLFSAGNDAGFYYFGVSATGHDATGSITALQYWGAACGPPRTHKVVPKSNDPKDIAEADRENARTDRPYPGLTMAPDQGSDCTTSDPDAVRLSARLSKGWQKPDDIQGLHWVRAGYH